MKTAEAVKQITAAEREERMTDTMGYADGLADRRSPWWAGVPGLDPWCPRYEPGFAARTAAMACAAHILGPDVTRRTVFRGGASPLAKDLHRWLADHRGDDLDAYLRRLALRVTCDIPGMDAEDVLAGAQALHAAVAGR